MKKLSKLNIFLITLIASLVIVLFAFFYYKAETKEIIKDKHEFINAVTELKLEQLLQWKKERNADAKFFPTIGQFIKHTDYLNTNQNVKKANEYFSKTLRQFIANGYDENIVIVNLSGKILFTVDDKFIQFDDDRIEEIKRALEIDSVVFGDFYFDSLKNKPLINIISVIKDNNRIPFAVFIQQVDPNKSLISVIQKWPTNSKTAETLLFNKEKDSIVYLNELRHLKDTALKLKIPISQTDVVAVKGVQGKRGIIEGKDYRGVEVLADVKSVPGTDWYLVSKIDKEELFSEIFYRAEVLILIALLSILFITATALYFYKLQQSRIYKNFFFKQKELSETQEEYRTALYSIGDGVITTDTHGVIKQINPVAEKLTGWKENEAKGLLLSKVFNIVNEETGNVVENPVELVLRKGLVVGLANHTVLIRKDGKKLPIADSGSPIKDLENKIIGVVLVFRDQTEERAKEKSILESEERFRKAFTTSPDSVNINKLSNGRYVSVNNGFLKLTGYTVKEVIGKTSYEINIWADISDRDTLVKRLKEYGVVENFEARFRIKNGEVKDGLMSAAILEINGEKHILSITRDISERKHAEQLIINSEANLNSLINNRDESIWSIDKDYNFIVFNNFFKESYLEAFNIKLEIGLNALDILTPELRTFWKPKYDAALKGEKIVFEFSSHVGKEFKYFEIYLNPILVEKTISGVSALSVDISDRRNAERALHSSEERLRLSLSAANQGLYDLNIQTGEAIINDEYASMLGYDPKTFKETNSLWIERLHPDDREITSKAFIDYISGKTSEYRVEFRQRTIEGQWTWILSMGKIVEYDSVGKPLRMLGTHTNINERKIAEEGLKKSELQFRTLAENSPVGIFRTDSDGYTNYVNPRWCQISKLSFDQALGDGWLTGVHPADRGVISESWKNASLNKRASEAEYRFLHTDGSISWVLGSAIPLKDNQDNIIGFIGTITDITDNKKIEAELKKLSISVEQSPVSIVITDTKGNIEYVNPKFSEISGYSLDEVKGKNPRILSSGQMSSKKYQELWDTILSGNEWHGEFYNKKKDGGFYWESASISPIMNPDGHITHFVAVKEDISEKKKMNEQLMKSEEQFRSIWENSVDAMRLLDENGIVINVNDAYSKLFDVKKEDLIGKLFNSSYIMTEPESMVDKFKERLGTKKIQKKFETRLLLKNEREIWAEFTNSFIGLENEKQLLLSIIRDITDRKNIITELTEAKNKAEEMNRVKSYFYANMSHELRTPFVGIMGFSEILAGSLKDREEREMAEQILKSSKRLTDTLNKILNVTRIEFDKVEPSNVEFNVSALINNLQSFYSSSAKLKNTTITTELQHPQMTFKSDPRLLEDILNNLVSNSVKFTEGGNINLAASIDLAGEKNILTIKVQDTGIGIPKDKQDLVWYEFRQASEGLNRSFEGTGLGLTITKKYVEILGGEITLESQVNTGTTFTIKLPMKKADHKTTAKTESIPNEIKVEPKIHTDKKYKILYVEDDMIALNYISIILKSLYDVTTAFSAKIAAELVNTVQYDALMLDINLGRGMDGVELMQIIRKMKNYKTTPIVAVTAYAAQSDKEEFLEKGFSHYISKPFTSAELKNLLSSLFKINSA